MLLSSHCSQFPRFVCAGGYAAGAACRGEPFCPETGSGWQSGAEAGAQTMLDAPSDVITAVMYVSCPELRKSFKDLFTFKYLETYIYRLLMLPGPKLNSVFISLVLQILRSALCHSALLGDVHIHALSHFLAGYNRSFDNVGSKKLRLKLIP